MAPVTTGKGRGCPLYTRSLSPPLLSTGNVSEALGDQPDPASLPPLPTFTSTGGGHHQEHQVYNEAFTGRARSIPRCPHCLADDHGGITCPHNPYPPVLGWSAPLQLAPPTGGQPPAAPIPPKPPAAQEVCRNFNAYRCRCRYAHVCSDCRGPHTAVSCPLQQSSSAGRGPTGRSRPPPRPRQPHPYFPPQGSTGAEQP